MTLDVQALIERRRFKRRLSLWRFIAVIAVLIALGVILAQAAGDGFGITGKHIARVTISGFITDDRKQQELLQKITKAKKVKALILKIDSPGGTTAGSEALYEAVLKVAKKKPVVAVMGTVAASGGYMTAIAADHIVARGSTITGSIGVIVQWPEVEELLGKLGVKYREVKSSPLKASPSPFIKADEEALEVTRQLVLESHEWFKALVAKRRKLDSERAAKAADGRIFTGRMALKAGLVDEIGSEDQARKWLEDERSIQKKLKIRDWKKESLKDRAFSHLVISAIGRLFGVETSALELFFPGSKASSRLDGLLSVWHPALR